jgi:hypothetical protein
VSTETGEDKSGHITAGVNEGILFFDSKLQVFSTQASATNPRRFVSPEVELAPTITLAC